MNSLHIDNLELEVYLGWSEHERDRVQTVCLSIELISPTLLKAALTDHLDDTLCYEALETALLHALNAQTFHLIEHLGYRAAQILKALLPKSIEFKLKVRKNLDEHRGSRSYILHSHAIST